MCRACVFRETVKFIVASRAAMYDSRKTERSSMETSLERKVPFEITKGLILQHYH